MDCLRFFAEIQGNFGRDFGIIFYESYICKIITKRLKHNNYTSRRTLVSIYSLASRD